MLKFAYVAVFAAFTSVPVSAQDTVTWHNDINGWSVAVDRTIDNSCFIISGFEDDLFLRFQFNAAQQNIQFIVASARWSSLVNGDNYALEVAFGGQEPWSGQAKGHLWNGILPSLVLSVPVADQQASLFMQDFTAHSFVSIAYEGSEIARIDLEGTEEAVASMLACQDSMSRANKLKKAGPDPFSPKADRI